MIDTSLKYQDEIPLNYQYTLKNNEGQEGKIGLFWRLVPVGRG
jgi:hypothetical protein